jgi:hypothetical protein
MNMNLDQLYTRLDNLEDSELEAISFGRLDLLADIRSQQDWVKTQISHLESEREDSYSESAVITRLMQSAEPKLDTTEPRTLIPETCIRSLKPYRLHGQWVFDDQATGLVAEAFVCGMSEIIDCLLTDSGINPKEVREGFRLTFSSVAFPNHTHSLTWCYPEAGGNVYRCELSGMVGWLCPALYKYFQHAPQYIYFRVDRIED